MAFLDEQGLAYLWKNIEDKQNEGGADGGSIITITFEKAFQGATWSVT